MFYVYNKKITIIFLIVFCLICFFSINQPFIVLLPPIVAIFLAFVCKNIILSMSSAIILGSIIANKNIEGLYLTASKSASDIFDYTTGSIFNLSNFLILVFVAFIMLSISFIQASGGMKAVISKLDAFVSSAKSAQLVTFISGLFLFIDDYANTMVIGSTMKSLTDKFKISREKLAFIVDATSAPVAGLAFVSTWVGYEVGLFNDIFTGTVYENKGYSIFFEGLSFRFYCWFMLAFVFFNIVFKSDFGPMKKAEEKSKSKNLIDLSEQNINKDNQKVKVNDKHDMRFSNVKNKPYKIWCFIAPIFLLLAGTLFGFFIDGGGFDKGSIFSFTNWKNAILASQNSVVVLVVSSSLSLLASLVLGFSIGDVTTKNSHQILVTAAKQFFIPFIILVLAWSLKEVCSDIKTAEYLTQLFTENLDLKYLPIITVIIAALTAFSTGTSWGTMAILIPVIGPVAIQASMQASSEVAGASLLLLPLTLSAILDGSIMGDHCSPISDTTIMSAASSECDLVSHVKTQAPYSITVFLIAILFGYGVLTIYPNKYFSLAAGFFVLLIFNFIIGKKNNSSKRISNV